MAVSEKFLKILDDAEREGIVNLAVNNEVFVPLSNSGYANYFSSDSISTSNALKLNSHWLWVAADRYAKFTQTASWALYRETSGGFDILPTNHFLYSIIERPNKKMRRSQLWYLTMMAKQAIGNAFWYSDLNQYGLPAQFKFISPSWGQVVPIQDQFGDVVRYEMSVGGEQKKYPTENIIHFKYPTINSSVYGKSPGMSIMETHEFDLMVKTYYLSMMKNGAYPAHYFTTPQPLSDAARKEFKTAYNEKAGYGNAGKPFLADRGIEAKTLSFSPREFESNEFLKMNRDQFAQAYALSKAVMTISDSTNRADAEAGIYVTARFGFQPALDDFAEDLTFEILKKYDDYVFLKFDSVVADDAKTTAEVYDRLIRSGQMKPNEAREQADRNPEDGGDELYVDQNLIPMKLLNKFWETKMGETNATISKP